MNQFYLKVREKQALNMLQIKRIFSKRQQFMNEGKVWDLSTDGCSMSDEKIVGNVRFLLQRRTQNFIREYIKTEDISDKKLAKVLESQIKSQAGIFHLLRIAKFGLRELANEAYAFNYDNLYKYLDENGLTDFSFVSANEIANVIPMTNERFKQIVRRGNLIPQIYYSLIKYALRIMLQRYLEITGECEFSA